MLGDRDVAEIVESGRDQRQLGGVRSRFLPVEPVTVSRSLG